MKTQKISFKSIPAPEYMGVWGERLSGKGYGALHPFPTPCPVHLFRLAAPDLYLFIIKQGSGESTIFQSSGSHSSKCIEPKEGMMGTSDLQAASQKYRYQPWAYHWCLK